MAATPPSMTFLTFLQGMGSQALVQFGLIPHPATGERKADPAYARATVRILELLEEKTRGNLTPEEAEYLRTVLASLHERAKSLPTAGHSQDP